jgi:hypothetical protein
LDDPIQAWKLVRWLVVNDPDGRVPEIQLREGGLQWGDIRGHLKTYRTCGLTVPNAEMQRCGVVPMEAFVWPN